MQVQGTLMLQDSLLKTLSIQVLLSEMKPWHDVSFTISEISLLWENLEGWLKK